MIAWVLGMLGGHAEAPRPAQAVPGPTIEVAPREGRWFEVRVASEVPQARVVVSRSDPTVAVHAVDSRGRVLAPVEDAEGQAAFLVDVEETFHVGLAAATPASVTWEVQLWTEDVDLVSIAEL